MVESSINGLFSMAMLNNQMVSSINQTWLAGNSLTKTEVSSWENHRSNGDFPVTFDDTGEYCNQQV